MKRKLSIILATVLIIVATSLPSIVFAAGAAEEEVRDASCIQ